MTASLKMDKLETIAIIPLSIAGLCPQCNAIINNRTECPVCHSQLIPIAEKFEEESTATPKGYGI